MPILEGLLTGAATIIFLGPVFFTLLQVTLDHGTKAGLSVAVGILASDILIVAMLYFSTADFIQSDAVQRWMAIAGSILLFGLGLKYILKPQTAQTITTKPSLATLSGAFTKGFLVNFVNPFVFFVWISFLAYAQSRFDAELGVPLYLSAALVGILITDVLKVLLAARLQKLLSPVFLKRVFRLIGVVLIGFSIRLVAFAVWQQ